MAKAPKAPKAPRAAKTPKAPTTRNDATAQAPTPDETFAARVAGRVARVNGKVLPGKKTFTVNRAAEVTCAALRLGLDMATVDALLTGRAHTLTPETVAALSLEADKVRTVIGGRQEYYTLKAFARFAFNEGAPGLSLTDALPLIAAGRKIGEEWHRAATTPQNDA